MGRTVQAVTQTFTDAAKGVVEGVKDIAQGDVGSGLKQVGQGIIDTAKASTYEATKAGWKTLYQDVTTNPSGALLEGIQAVSTGGASLIPAGKGALLGAVNEVGSSLLSQKQSYSPSQLAAAPSGGGGTAPMIPAQQAFNPMPYMIFGLGLLLVFVLVKRR